jgi:lactoylglutathione lyase
MISHVQLVTIYVSNLERASEFYTQKLGFELLAEWQDEKTNDRMLFLAPKGAKETEIGLYAPPGGDARMGASTGMVFTAEDIEATYQEMTAQGVYFTKELTLLPYGNRPGGDLEAEFVDPDGNTFLLHT